MFAYKWCEHECVMGVCVKEILNHKSFRDLCISSSSVANLFWTYFIGAHGD